jgi:hypothetical protein
MRERWANGELLCYLYWHGPSARTGIPSRITAVFSRRPSALNSVRREGSTALTPLHSRSGSSTNNILNDGAINRLPAE